MMTSNTYGGPHPIPVWRIFGIKADTLVTFLYCLSALLGVVGIVAGCFLQAPYSTPVCVIGTAIYAGMESMSRRPAPLWAYPVFFAVALALLFSLFGDYNLLPVT